MVLDIVGSTEQAALMGDARWRALLDEHNRVANRELDRHRGTLIDMAGDGFLATFEGPAAAIRCAQAIQRIDRSIGMASRAGVHCGEVERAGAGIRGISVHVASRLAALADPSQILATTTVRDLAAGSGLNFEDRGIHELKGVPEPRQVLAVAV